MSPHESDVYLQFHRAVEVEIQQLRQCIRSLHSSGITAGYIPMYSSCVLCVGSERVWLRHQSTGDLDDLKLVDGTGVFIL
jgi:hypothetical protein